jgi:hypothetical protein
MKRLAIVVLAVAGMSAGAVAQEVDLKKAVQCVTLSQQFTDSVKTAKAEDDAKKAATEMVKQGDQACMAHDYDAGMDQLRKALQQIGLKPIV